MKDKVDLLLQPLSLRQYCLFKGFSLLLCVSSVCRRGPMHAHFIISVAVAVCPPQLFEIFAQGCMLVGVCQEGGDRSTFTVIRCVCFLTERSQTIMCGRELFMADALCKKGTKMHF